MVALDDLAQRGVEGGVAAGVAEDEVVHHLDRRRAVGQHVGRGAERVEQLVELQRDQRLDRRQWHQADRRLGDEAQRALRPDHQAGEIDGRGRIDEGVEVVAADAAQHLREAAVDLVGVPAGERRHLAGGAGQDRVAARGVGQRLRRERAELRAPTRRPARRCCVRT